MRHPHAPTAAIAIVLCAVAAACASGEQSTTAATTTNPNTTGSAATTSAPTTTTPTTTTPTTTTPTTTAPAPTTTAAPATTTTPSTAAAVSECVAALDRRDRIALLVWPAVYSAAWDDALRTVGEQRVGGVLLMEPSGWDTATLMTRLGELDAASAHGLIIATDEEGGDVQRLRLVAPLPSQRTVSQTITPAEAEELIADHGQRVAATGVDMVLGPVVDVEPNVGDVPLQPSRFFVGPPDVVSEYAASYVAGWSRAGLMSVLKHYPGHGAASGDTHITAGVTPSLEDLAEWDLKPYADLVDPDGAVMVGHLTVPDLTDGAPATRSRAAIDHLRTTLGWHDALVITDALGMDAVGIPEPEAAVLAIEAGIDVVLFTRTAQTGPVIDAIERAVGDGRISDDALSSAATKVLERLPAGADGC